MNIQAKEFFRLLSDDTRLRCLLLMQAEGELCVCEMMHALDMIQPKISRHLALLRDAGVVIGRRQGQWIYYRLNPQLPEWAQQVVACTAEAMASVSPYGEDRLSLDKMANRPSASCCA
ncbi:MAG TPA: metalloregulator ArsR/SmtB family transcription factor [Gammaproteobacteria bacterium]|nr:metalloregulator ArsR/SmtB family transcription factor [Gammaproteobacteria bacterium]